MRRAVYHFADDRKTADRQAEALVELGLVLDRRRQDQEARGAFAAAYRLDAERAAATLGTPFMLREPKAPLAALARATTGWMVADGDDLDDSLASLDRCVRLTYQVSGLPDGDLHPVEVRCERDAYRLHVPGWARFSIPETVSAARARRLLAAAGRPGKPPRGDLGVFVRPGGEAGGLEVPMPEKVLEEEGERDDLLVRVTLGTGDPEAGELEVEHHTPRGRIEGRDWVGRVEVPDLEEDEPWLALVIEDLVTGRWGATVVELDETVWD